VVILPVFLSSNVLPYLLPTLTLTQNSWNHMSIGVIFH